MNGLVLSLAIGWAGSLIGGTILGIRAHRRMIALQDRTRHAERLAELGTLTGGLAHEIKNPLSTVQLNLQLLQEDLPPDDPAFGRIVHRLATVKNETTRLRGILDDFLRYAGRLELDRAPTNLNNLLDELVDFFVPQAQSQHVQLRLKMNPSPIIANVDAKLIKQAVLNLMLNGVQAMPSGGELILSLSATPTDAIIDVIDTGPGIELDVIDKIFGAYYSTKRGGTGLGLPMTKRLATEHGGSLTVTSDLGRGSDFRLSLPLKG